MPKSDEEIPTVPHPKAQNPPPYVILTYFGYVSESHRTCRPLIPGTRGKNNRVPTRQVHAGAVSDLRPGITECVSQTAIPEMNMLLFKPGVAMA